MPTGTNSSETLFFEGSLSHLLLTIVNPYTGESIQLNDIYFTNNTTYDGLAGNDLLAMTNIGDALFLEGTGGIQTIKNIETIAAGDGGDAIILSSKIFSLGGMLIDGGLANDILWANNGDDRVNGNSGDDIINGGGGNDRVFGQAGDDNINGGPDADFVSGDDGNDTLVYSVDGAWSNLFALSISGGVIATGSGTASLVLDSSMNRSFDHFNGGNDTDTLVGTAGNDVLLLQDALSLKHNTASGARLLNVENINMGDGNDVVDLQSALYSYGNVTIRGEAGNDWLRSGGGNDVMYGGFGNDRLIGGAGNDILYGGNNDAALAVDKDFHDAIAFPGLREGTNIVNLLPPGDPSLGIADGNLDVGFDSTATITFRQGFAGYNNTLGIYAIANDGTIQSASILWANVKTAGIDVTHTIDLPTDDSAAQLGFFIIADGDNVNHHYNGLNITGDNVINFVYDYGLATERTAKITDAADRISIVYDDGILETVLKGYDYHTTDRGGSTSLNWDGKTHVVSGLAAQGDDDVLRIGFEDLPCTGDADYEDVLFDFNINPGTHDTSEVGNDILIGGLGNDTLYGEAGNDILVIGLGADRAYGGGGSDIIAYDSMDALVDIIFGFETGVGRDSLNLSALLEGFDAGDDINSFVQLVDNGSGTEVQVNADGDAGGTFTTIALIDGGVHGASLTDLVADGNLVVNAPLVL